MDLKSKATRIAGFNKGSVISLKEAHLPAPSSFAAL